MNTPALESTLTCPHCGHARTGADAHRRLPVVLRMHGLPCRAQAAAGRLLRLLLLRQRALSAHPVAAAAGRGGRLLRLTYRVRRRAP
ncbi:MAG: hypothetical protein MZU91_12505 [Desulfosudis oleivorans]|nr:hypothetical protein [Desulfosudis oleivorans]